MELGKRVETSPAAVQAEELLGSATSTGAHSSRYRLAQSWETQIPLRLTMSRGSVFVRLYRIFISAKGRRWLGSMGSIMQLVPIHR